MEIKIFGDKKLKIRKLLKKDLRNVKQFRDFINSFIEEDAQISQNEKISLKEERKWLEARLKSIRKHKTVFLVAEDNGIIVGTTGIDLGFWRHSHVGRFGITIRKGYRGIGLGSYLIKEIIKLAKKNLRPKPEIIRLGVLPTNKPAIELYKNSGFKKVAVIPKQMEFQGKLRDEIIMLLYL